MVEEIVEVDPIKRGRGRPKKDEEDKVDLKDKDVRRKYNSKFYAKHAGEKKHCTACEKSYAWYNFSKHMITTKHLQTVEKLYRENK